nr:MAG TPA: hypothetical protein [Caudoviricetes sp.]
METSNRLRLLVFLCIPTHSGVFAILRTRQKPHERTSNLAFPEHKMLTKNAN